MILVVAEHENGAVSKSTRELISAARSCSVEGPIAVLILGSGVAQVATDAARFAEQVLVADLPHLATYDAQVWAAAVAQIASEGEAALILIAGSRAGREFSPRVAVRLDAALMEDIVSLHAEGSAIRGQHYTFLSRVTETVEATGTVVATVKPGAFEPSAPLPSAGEQYDVDLTLPEHRLQVTGLAAQASTRVSLSDADIVVAGGRGVGDAANFATTVEALADRLGGAVGATRAVVDAGWRPYAEQVGQTGKSVQPKLYIALGISGAVQHLSGMNKSKLIVAINKDADAPIFTVADLGIVGDVAQIVPALLEQLRT